MVRKIKNPERYIRKLNNRIGELSGALQREINQVQREHGDLMVTWKDYTLRQATVNSNLAGFRAGDHVRIDGIVTMAKSEFTESCGNHHSEITIAVKETRRLPSDT